jgi:hypothetical protein
LGSWKQGSGAKNNLVEKDLSKIGAGMGAVRTDIFFTIA